MSESNPCVVVKIPLNALQPAPTWADCLAGIAAVMGEPMQVREVGGVVCDAVWWRSDPRDCLVRLVHGTDGLVLAVDAPPRSRAWVITADAEVTEGFQVFGVRVALADVAAREAMQFAGWSQP